MADRVFWMEMIYQCDQCGHKVKFLLEEGCEGPKDTAEMIVYKGPPNPVRIPGKKYPWPKTAGGRFVVPVPFVAAGCPVCQGPRPWDPGKGVLQHVEWHNDRIFLTPMVGEFLDRARFLYPGDASHNLRACGHPVFAGELT